MRKLALLLVPLTAFALVAVACSSDSSSTATASGSHEPVTITVWDYYGKATPFQDSVIQGFEQKYPWITVQHQDVTWDQARDSGGPDVHVGLRGSVGNQHQVSATRRDIGP